MARFFKARSKKVGMSPGTLVHIGERKTEKVKITVIDYDSENYFEKELENVEDCFPFKQKPSVSWLNIDGIHDMKIIEKIGKQFDIHDLSMEDIVNTGHMPKIETFDDYIFIVLKMLDYDKQNAETTSEQVSLILGSNFVISFQERGGDIFNPLRERIKNGRGRHRKMGADYLAYTLLDIIVDHYFFILEKMGEKIEDLENILVANPTPEILKAIHKLKSDAIFLRKSIWPLREIVSSLTRSESTLIQSSTNIFLRDVYDHTIQIIDTVETFRDLITGMLDIYLSSVSNKMNEVMKVLTIIATIFIPLSFVVGLYGMNFSYMPELAWHWGYFTVLGFMGVIVLFMLSYFKKKKWL